MQLFSISHVEEQEEEESSGLKRIFSSSLTSCENKLEHLFIKIF
jgi:hypothetical protein